MKKLLLILLLCTAPVLAQTKFESGYFITNDGNKVSCLIKNNDWRFNPTEFKYKLSEDGQAQIATISTVKEFGFPENTKFIRAEVQIDISTHIVNDLSTNSAPEFNDETLFLKVLVEGDATLYSYNARNLTRYFYNTTTNSEITQLVYKSYLTPKNTVGKNNRYKQQLWSDLKCDDITFKKAKYTSYAKKDLITYFTEYNACKNGESISYERQNKNAIFHLSIRPGVKFSSLNINTPRFWYYSPLNSTIDFGKQTNFRIGALAEVVLPFNNNKWSFIFEPTYQSFKKEVIVQNSSNTQSGLFSIDYKSLELPFGVRYHFFLGEENSIFLNMTYSPDILLGKQHLKLPEGSYHPDNPDFFRLESTSNFCFGLGVKIKKKYSLEFKYDLKRDLLKDFQETKTEYKSVSIILGYQIF